MRSRRRTISSIAPILVGPEDEIRKIATAQKINTFQLRIVATADAEESAARAAAMASKGEAQALMKGSLHTDQFMHAIVAKENHLRTNRLLSHCMLISLPTYTRRVIISDAAINIAPGRRSEEGHHPERDHPRPRHRDRSAEGGDPLGGRGGKDEDAIDDGGRGVGKDGRP